MSPKRPSLRAAINAMCKDCIYDDQDSGTWRQQVTACIFRKCPLWPIRPLAKGQNPAANASNEAETGDPRAQPGPGV